MKTNVKQIGSALLLLLIALLPALVRAEPAVPLFDKAKLIVEQLQDLESMQRNVEACYFSEKRTSTVASRSARLWPEHAELDGKLLNRVFSHLAGTPEYEGFMSAYRSLVQRPDYRRLHTDELFAEYMRLLESGRMRFLTQLKDCQEGSAERFPVQAHEGLAGPIPAKTARFGLANGSERPGSGRAVAAIQLHIHVPSSGSKPLTMGQKSPLRIVVRGMKRSSVVSSATPATDVVELEILVVEELTAPLEEVTMHYGYDLVHVSRSRPRTNPRFSGAVEKGVEARQQ